MPKQTLDYSLYLVTGRELLPSGKVRSAINLAQIELTIRIITSPLKRCGLPVSIIGATS